MQGQIPKLLSNNSSMKSQIVIQQSKSNQVNSLLILTKQLNQQAILGFLVGFVIGELKLSAINKENNKIYHKIFESGSFIKQKLLQIRNVIESIVQSLQAVKQTQRICQQNKKPKQIKNRMHSQYEQYMQQEKIPCSQIFLSTFAVNIQQSMFDKDYLRNLWARQTFHQIQQRKQLQAIRKMLDQQQKQQVLKRKQRNLKMQNQKSQCQICLVEIQYTDMGTLSNCEHIFHRQCLHDYIKSQVQANRIDMNCPMQECNKIISTVDIEEYLEGDILEKYIKFSLNKYVQNNNNDTSWCPTAGCPALFEFDEQLDNYRCPACLKHYCLKCRCNYHYGMTCAQYRITNTYSKDDENFQKFVRGAKFKQCPKCKFWVQRVQGCSTMSCRCGIQFCYDCGGTQCPHGMCSNSGGGKVVQERGGRGRGGRKR